MEDLGHGFAFLEAEIACRPEEREGFLVNLPAGGQQPKI